VIVGKLLTLAENFDILDASFRQEVAGEAHDGGLRRSRRWLPASLLPGRLMAENFVVLDVEEIGPEDAASPRATTASKYDKLISILKSILTCA
jgi:hypothetical protein